MKLLDCLAVVLLIIGGLNWGIVGLIDYNIMAHIFGEGAWLTRAFYMAFGVSAIYHILYFSCCCRHGNGNGRK
jgi:hypothetical protein